VPQLYYEKVRFIATPECLFKLSVFKCHSRGRKNF